MRKEFVNERFEIKIGRRIRHVEGDGRTAIVKRLYAYPLVTVEWEGSGRDPTETMAYPLPVFNKITVRVVTYLRGKAVQVTAFVNSDCEGERAVVSKWTSALAD
ncbi:hypothetical protein ACIPX0_49870 [Streptomyces sp. NPDC090075]|uniref:hypothetical protein n=1 Tax=Streptomyces sp. NPDC090075 TaxID=3365937 RepID=UPI00381C9228